MFCDNETTYNLINYYGDREYRSLRSGTPSPVSSSAIQNEINKWASCHCMRPKKVYQPNHFTGELEYNYFSCGQCDHCRNIKSNELLTRIYLDSKIQGHLYFVTLTYTSVYVTDDGYYGLYNTLSYPHKKFISYPINNKVMKLLSKNILHYDNYNYNKKFCYSTCLLDMDDFSGFMKRLRAANEGVRFQCVAFGEYGSKYGHPHMHALISSNKAMSKSDFQDAWSIYNCPIGNIDVDNLFTSGRANSIEATTKYVTKYVSKKDVANNTRLHFAHNLRFGVFAKNKILNYIISQTYQNYEFLSNYFSQESPIYRTLYQADYPKYFKDFCRQVSQYPRYSLGTAFGSLYFSANLGRFMDGNKGLPSTSTTKLSFPRYFERSLQREKYPLSVYKVSRAGSKFLACPNVPSAISSFEMLDKGVVSHRSESLDISHSSWFTGYDSWYIKNDSHFYDRKNRIHLMYIPLLKCFIPFKYNRSAKYWQYAGKSISLDDLKSQYLSQEEARYKEIEPLLKNKYYQTQMYNLLLCDLNSEFVFARELEDTKWSNQKAKSISKIQQNKYNTL